MGLSRIVCRRMLPVLAAGLWFGCAQTAPVVEIPAATPEVDSPDFVTGPLPGVDSLVIQDVVETFDSTFVDALAEKQAQQVFLEGQMLVEHVDSMLTYMVGPSVLDSASADVDSAAFADAHAQARQILVEAAQAQAAQDSVRAQSLLDQARRLLEDAVSLNPWHEQAQYQLAQVYTIRADHFKQQGDWEQVLGLLRGLVALRANEHGLWAEIALTLDNLARFSASGVLWLQAAETVLDDARLAFDPVAVDSIMVFTYSVRSYRAFVQSRSGEGVRRALAQAWQYATSAEESDFAQKELVWAQWDYQDFEHRLVYDSLRSAAADDPSGVLAELGVLIPMLTRPAARLEASYHHAILSYDNGYEDTALDTLQGLWHRVEGDAESGQRRFADAIDSLAMDPLPYAEFQEDLRTAYASFLFERALFHRQAGGSALAFTYLMQVAQLESVYTGKAYLEAIKLARYNPEQALQIEPMVEAVFSTLTREDQLAYLVQMGGLYRRLGKSDKTNAFRDRYRVLRNDSPN